jgi:PEP-CTERM motif
MKRTLLAMAALTGLAVGQARADTVVGITLSGAGISGNIVISYGAATDSKYPGQGFEITGIGGTFSDTALGIVGATITSLVPISPTSPLDPLNLLAPHDFSHFAVASGLPMDNAGFLTYDNLFWPNGAPPTASDFDGAGGFLDIYGLMFNLGGDTVAPGTVVDLFDNGVSPTTGMNYGGFGVAVVTSTETLSYVAGGVTATAPEPSTWAMMLLGFAGLGFAGYRKSRKAAISAV